jgi:cation diffusion facilitator CzcD-associated flavoprotein CzcO
VDVLIVGAGLSGIGAAHHLAERFPNKTYAIVEGRDRLGGTWDLFRYPGIRSDSDMYTLGYRFRPWTNPKAIADGASILSYIEETAEANGIARNITFGTKVLRAKWSTEDAMWTVDCENVKTKAITQRKARFLFLCSGYYDYEGGYTPEFEGTEKFRGRIVHPQKWTDDIEWEGKRVVVIGSGATAVTLVPELSKRAAHVTMLQRSPTYIVSLPAEDPIANYVREKISPKAAYALVRWKNVLLGMAMFGFCRRFPERAKRLLLKQVKKQLADDPELEKHFTPTYNPWDQRMCLVPDADLFAAIREKRVSVVTDHIDHFTEKGIRLKSGDELEADLIVTATGLKMKCLGGVALEVDGKPIDPSKTLVYKGMMCSDVPNMAFAVGYTNASWTLKTDLTCEYVCRMLAHMDEHQYAWCCPRRNDPSIEELPLIDFSSGYVQRAIAQFPKQGSARPWKLYQNYALDLLTLRHFALDDRAMEFHS